MEAIFRVFYHLIDRIRSEILNTQIDDLERIMHLLRVVMFDLSSDDMAKFFEKCIPVINNSSNQQSIYSINSRLEQYRLEYQILQEEFVHLKQINKLAVEQKLQLKQKQQLKFVQPQPTIEHHRRNSMETFDETSASCLAKLIECLRDENRRLREQNLQLSRQVEELQCQVRRQSH
ncbi:TBC1 domain containing protein [Euroglyphus maynei]|uniref:TBC1 domain containing protein n=1 Tax=Euroglyphus maynei TaxID=6958 RepID=A0A1Y3BQS7_EURMA|nr:TBC1 domain containing protein [Euroglyphus maynei]